MAKLYFRHGTVSSAKTLNLLAAAHNYRQRGKKILLLKPAVDTRFGLGVIKTRAGLELTADIVVAPDVPLSFTEEQLGAVCVLVDEAQFLPVSAIDYLHSAVVINRGIPVICYGLRTDFRTVLFPAAKRLLELADSIEEIKTICHFCLRKAIFNLKLLDGKATLAGPSVELGCEEKYLPVCAACYAEQHRTTDH
jgi:thymidine kinase